LMTFGYNECFGALKMSDGYLQFQAPQLRILPIIVGGAEQQNLTKESILDLSNMYLQLYNERKSAADILISQFKLSHISEKLRSIDRIGWNEFIEELEKLKVPIFINKTDELNNWFRKKQQQFRTIQSQADLLEEAIDREVYQIYRLTDDEITAVNHPTHSSSRSRLRAA
jgi:hypothetical protein